MLLQVPPCHKRSQGIVHDAEPFGPQGRCLNQNTPSKLGVIFALLRSGRWAPAANQGHDEIGSTRTFVALATGRHDEIIWTVRCIEQASAAGYHEDAQQDFKDAPLAGSVDAPKDETGDEGTAKGPLKRMLARNVWCQEVERYFDIKSRKFISGRALNAANVGVAEYGCTGTDTAEAQFQNHSDARKATLVTYRPGARNVIVREQIGEASVTAVNTWYPSSVLPAKNVTDADIRPWLDHVELIFGPPYDPAAKHVLDWCAFLLQNPGKKIGHALVVISPTHGVGKDTVFTPILRAVGMHNVKPITPETLASPWTHYLLSQVVVVEEMMNFKRGELANKLKPMLSTPPETVTINIKNVKQAL